jgi:hypothetical protein
MRDEIFCMTQRADETLEDYAKRFQFSYKCATNYKLDDESLKLVLLRGVIGDLMEALDLMSCFILLLFNNNNNNNPNIIIPLKRS